MVTGNDLAWTAQKVLAATFLLSGVAKVRDAAGAVEGALEYRLLPERLVRLLAPMLPAAEIALGIVLVTGVATRGASIASAALVAIFTVAVSVNLRRGRLIACHCFGASSRERIGRSTLLRLAVLGVAAAVLATFTAGAPQAKVAPSAPATTLLSIVVAVTLLLALLGPGALLADDVAAVRRARNRHRHLAPDPFENASLDVVAF
jgi:uncharacterized membrane protein YphA (DoxX/SURF4 family)